MNATLYSTKKQYAEQLLADLEAREQNGEFDGNRNSEWRKKYDALEVALCDLAREVGEEYSIEDLPELAAIFNVLAGWVFGSVNAYYFNEDGDCPLSEAEYACISANDCNADYFQAPCAHSCMGDTFAQYIRSAIDPREFTETDSDHQRQSDEITLKIVK